MAYIIIFLIAIGIAVAVWFLLALRKIFLKAIVASEYEKYLSLKYNYPTVKLKILHADLQNVIEDIKKDIENDILSAQKAQEKGSSQLATNWMKKNEENRKWLKEMEDRYQTVSQELNRRIYFKSTW